MINRELRRVAWALCCLGAPWVLGGCCFPDIKFQRAEPIACVEIDGGRIVGVGRISTDSQGAAAMRALEAALAECGGVTRLIPSIVGTRLAVVRSEGGATTTDVLEMRGGSVKTIASIDGAALYWADEDALVTERPGGAEVVSVSGEWRAAVPRDVETMFKCSPAVYMLTRAGELKVAAVGEGVDLTETRLLRRDVVAMQVSWIDRLLVERRGPDGPSVELINAASGESVREFPGATLVAAPVMTWMIRIAERGVERDVAIGPETGEEVDLAAFVYMVMRDQADERSGCPWQDIKNGGDALRRLGERGRIVCNLSNWVVDEKER